MLSHEDNAKLTRVGPGTPLGALFRRYWIPAAMTADVPEPGGAPARVKLLGEKLVVYRDPEGTLGLMKEHCPHRGASLFYGRNEVGGLRCLYHGWKMGGCGALLETPPEPASSPFTARLRHTAYKVREAGGIIWAYMGPAEAEPPFPRFPWLDLPAENLLPVKMYQHNNWLQGCEGDLDPAHPNYLHRDFQVDDRESWAAAGWQSIAMLMNDGAPEIICEETPYLMRVAAIRNTGDPATAYVRTTEWAAPFYAYIATGPHECQLFKAWQPIDDETCFTFYIHFDPAKPVDREGAYRNWGHQPTQPGWRTDHTLENRHFQDRSMMGHNFSGIVGAAIQDRAVQESMGFIYDRTQEHLGTSDRAVVFYRRLLLKLMDQLAAGHAAALPGLDPALDYRQRGSSVHMPRSRDWHEADAVLAALERGEALPALA